jgi:ATP citrate (pro-S)-lyase
VIPLYIQVGDLGYAHELGNYAEYSGAPNEEETLQYARALIDVSLSSAERSLCSSGAP